MNYCTKCKRDLPENEICPVCSKPTQEELDLIKKKVAIKVAAHKGANFENVVLWVIEEWEKMKCQPE